MLVFMTSLLSKAVYQSKFPSPEESVILRIGQNDQEALRTLYEQTNQAVYGFAYSILKNPQDAQDVLQDTFIQIHAAAPSYQCQGKPMAWILTITRNLALAKFRVAKRTAPLETDYMTHEPVCDGMQLQSEHKLILQSALNVLSDESRQIVILHAVSGMKHREIAKILGLNLSTVLSKYNRAIKLIKKILQEGSDHE